VHGPLGEQRQQGGTDVGAASAPAATASTGSAAESAATAWAATEAATPAEATEVASGEAVPAHPCVMATVMAVMKIFSLEPHGSSSDLLSIR
jgi:hypothetical protein